MNVKFVGGATIFVKVLPITDTKGKRLKVKLGNGLSKDPSMVIGWDYELEYSKNFEFAAKKFAEKLKWEGDMVGSWMGDNALFVFTN
jgi:hypothetical protein